MKHALVYFSTPCKGKQLNHNGIVRNYWGGEVENLKNEYGGWKTLYKYSGNEFSGVRLIWKRGDS